MSLKILNKGQISISFKRRQIILQNEAPELIFSKKLVSRSKEVTVGQKSLTMVEKFKFWTLSNLWKLHINIEILTSLIRNYKKAIQGQLASEVVKKWRKRSNFDLHSKFTIYMSRSTSWHKFFEILVSIFFTEKLLIKTKNDYFLFILMLLVKKIWDKNTRWYFTDNRYFTDEALIKNKNDFEKLVVTLNKGWAGFFFLTRPVTAQGRPGEFEPRTRKLLKLNPDPAEMKI